MIQRSFRLLVVVMRLVITLEAIMRVNQFNDGHGAYQKKQNAGLDRPAILRRCSEIRFEFAVDKI